jgi:hypothetical protein
MKASGPVIRPAWPPLILVASVFVVVPLTVFLRNLPELSLTLFEVIALSLVPAALVYAALLAINLLLSQPLRSAYAGVLSMLAILCWVQAILLTRNYGPLDGRDIDWNSFRYAALVDGLVWLIGLATGAALIWRGRASILFKLAVALLAIQLLSSVLQIGLNMDELTNNKRDTYNADPEQIYEFSKTQNIVHILVDGFQADVFADLLNHTQLGPAYAKSFAGFVYYPETLGAFPYTQFAVPALLTGRTYKNDVAKEEFIDTALVEKSILGVAREKGYEIDIAAVGAYLYNRYSQVRPDNIYRIDSLGKINPTIAEFIGVLDIAIFRLVPHGLKRRVVNDQKWVLQAMLAADDSFRYNFFQNTYFLSELTSNLSVTRDAPVYKYIHVMNTHRPMVADVDCTYAGRTFGDSRVALTVQSKCTLDTLVALMEKVKSFGIYDSSLFIVHGDHGGWIPNMRQGKPIRLASGSIAPWWIASLASPLLSIKLPESVGSLKISNVQASLLDLPDTISDAMGFETDFGHTSLSRLPTHEDRERRFYYYPWQGGEWDKAYTLPIQEFIIRGSHYENEWQLGEVYYPPDS